MDKQVSTVERYHTFVLLMLAGGFMGSYSYFLKGGVFANAETANLLILALSAANRNWHEVARVLVPITTFFCGSFFSEMFKSKANGKWPTILISCEMAILAVLALLPEGTPDTVYHVAIALTSSMQYNTFLQARGVTLSTLFCTAHLRGCGAALYHALKEKDHKFALRAGYHIGLILTFVIGAFICAVVSRTLGTHTLILAVIPLFFVLLEILRTRRQKTA